MSLVVAYGEYDARFGLTYAPLHFDRFPHLLLLVRCQSPVFMLPVSQGFPLVPAKITGFDYGLNCIVYIHVV